MKVDGGLGPMIGQRAALCERAAAMEKSGYAGVWASEIDHDPFLPLVLVAEHTERVQVGTSIAVAFARSPMTLAYAANDLQLLSEGRFVLGLGSQVKAHIERRFSMPWSHPAARMRELVAAVRAIWDAWETGAPLAFQGEFYSHTLMPPVFVPGPNPHGWPKIFLAAVGDRMAEVAGELADGVLLHSFTTPAYVRERTWPALERGLAASGRSRAEYEVTVPVFIATGVTSAERERAVAAVRGAVAFYGSTPAYAGVLEHHGWGSLQTDLQALAKRGDWDDMAALVDDEVLDTFAIVAEPDAVAQAVVDRYGDLVHRVALHAGYESPPELWDRIARDLAAVPSCPPG